MKEICPKCGEKISAWKGSATINTGSGAEKICSSCYKIHWAITYDEHKISEPATGDKETPKKSTLSTTDSLIAAQNRTTHAVRALAITFVAAPIIALVVIAAGFLAVSSGNTTLIVIVGLGGCVVTLATLISALEELRRSKVE